MSIQIDTGGLVDETAIENGDSHLIFTRDEFDKFDNQFCRRLAAQAATDVINGKSTRLEMKEYFCRQKTLADF